MSKPVYSLAAVFLHISSLCNRDQINPQHIVCFQRHALCSAPTLFVIKLWILSVMWLLACFRKCDSVYFLHALNNPPYMVCFMPQMASRICLNAPLRAVPCVCDITKSPVWGKPLLIRMSHAQLLLTQDRVLLYYNMSLSRLLILYLPLTFLWAQSFTLILCLNANACKTAPFSELSQTAHTCTLKESSWVPVQCITS